MIKEYFIQNWKMIISSILIILIAYSSVIYLGKNNAIELDLEQAFEYETGIKIDLTPQM